LELKANQKKATSERGLEREGRRRTTKPAGVRAKLLSAFERGWPRLVSTILDIQRPELCREGNCPRTRSCT